MELHFENKVLSIGILRKEDGWGLGVSP